MIRVASAEDRASVEGLLTAADLPIDGVDAHFDTFFVVDDGSKIIGAAGIELHGSDALLRSVVVAEDAKGTGLGSLLTRRALDEAAARGMRAVYLLTTTAETFFPKFGFERVRREEIPEALRASREFQGACPASAIAMRRTTK
jgi:amino-acid N-acetyltransferase